tara:strand:+ start:6442 stop:7491 length:1050 start_codon:yes stop_codon:yes gene_type:complete
MKILLPVAGKSSRYPGMRPKWLLTLPDGSLMVEKALSGINMEFVDEVVLIMLNEHSEFIAPDFLKRSLSKTAKNIPVNIFILNSPTPSQPSTIARFLKSTNQDFSFFIKDCDNYFSYKPESENSVAYVNLADLELVAASSKSFLNSNNFDEIELIAEKKVISDKFCCGGYSFNSSTQFLNTYDEIGGDANENLYISHIIQKLLLEGITFHSKKAHSYEDYGTAIEFKNYIKKTKSIFCDFDGVLVENSSKFSSPPWQYSPINENLNFLSNYLLNSPHSKLIITTSRPNSEENNIKKFLEEFNIKCHKIITDLPHAGRILVNDFSNTNPFPTANAINISRNAKNLCDYFN